MPTPTPETDCPRTDWFLVISLLLIGAIVGGMLGVSFAPVMVSFQ